MADTKEPRKSRYRIPVEIPEEEKPLWRKVRVTALDRGVTVGRFVIEALREKLEREGALPPADKPKKK